MIKNRSVLIFGHNEYGLEIAKNLQQKYRDITIFSLDDEDESVAVDSIYSIEKLDLSDNWDNLKNDYNIDESIVFCVLNDEAKNIFLTISLRSSFKELTIIALANNNEDANKLTMAGASKVIPIVETTANIITDMLKKPIITEVLHDILYEESLLKIEQITVNNSSYFDGKYPAEIEWSREHGVIIISIMHEDMSSEFIYSSKTKHQQIKDGDIFVAVGYEADLENFKRLIK
jgi:Trk K+ transport system NAD-binding subunit